MTTTQRSILLLLFIATIGIFVALGGMIFYDLGLSASLELSNLNFQEPTPKDQGPSPKDQGSTPNSQIPTPSNQPPTATIEPSPTQTALPSPTSLPTRTPTVTETPTPTSTPTIIPPPSAQITGIVGHGQSLPLSCESRSAADWAGYFGVQIDELNFLHGLPPSDNPERGFVGSVRGAWGQTPPDPYGVHAGPVASLLRAYGLKARAYHDLTWDQLRAEIASGEPVIVWIVGHVEIGHSLVYTTPNGLEVIVAKYEHTVIAIGYTEDSVMVLDGTKIYSRPLSIFLNSWGALGNMGIIMES